MFISNKVFDFTANAVLSDGSLSNNYNLYKNIDSKYVLLFFYPLDFTFVCPSELLAINNRITEFKKRNIEVITVSVDSHFVHKAWRETSLESGGLGGMIKYTMVSDITRSIMKSYDLYDVNSGVSFRGSLLIDDSKIIRVQHVHDFPIGRNIDEYIRIFDAMSFNQKYGNVCQAGWTKGSDGIVPTFDGVSKYLGSNYKNL